MVFDLANLACRARIHFSPAFGRHHPAGKILWETVGVRHPLARARADSSWRRGSSYRCGHFFNNADKVYRTGFLLQPRAVYGCRILFSSTTLV